ncbi:MAG: signal recognition particle protein [Piscirickettsiaceae bacterium CG_4_9_14_3_um_filter_43_564]|nr:signal recognition particle protein [Thiomicrospira sp.]OIP95526.1 MAG: signal recognition particle protein [Thiomicrospira sp. CG2_30_44_34]PIQ03711.1 MAG: signal recognition particle protein [Piscirickettsiaceae bacterium CG18_big_fil_WC_8_21_14_2_50_44_103]PIU39051.1 MAG: signal recognition particle protein [Piscirickettsiaceae bacterium CG07_land_8_20_14_0_80_44_28]PIW57014.1 MAG: signal recognition particle protein [Piscirickettsiaceae bacterium CG12_big_fil_rev_8_21_14_0_65_44_934]PIW
MFDSLSDRLTKSFKAITGQGRLTEANIKDALRDVRRALLEADVALSVVKTFIDQVQQRAIGQEVSTSLNPGQAFIKIVREQLTQVMGEEAAPLNFNVEPPAIIMVAGLQGAGKTTSVAKLARWLQAHDKKKVMVVSADVYRPAAIKQLETLASQVDVKFFPSSADQDPVEIAKSAHAEAKRQFMDVLILDTAGRMHIDEDMMQEIKRLHQAIKPIETLFVVDAMTGQDAANTAKVFNNVLPLTGVILTKTDGDARGGAALSIRQITGKPIKFIGAGEKTDALESFHPDRMAGRILGMGDVLSLIEEAESKIDQKKAQKFAKKIQKSGQFDLEDFLEQLQQINSMGGVSGLIGKMPGMGQMKGQINDQAVEKDFKRLEAIIYSMTRQERAHPAIIKGSRKKRIANGSGTQVQDINKLMKQFTQMQKMMKKVSKGGMKNMMRGMAGKMPGMGGMLPPGMK